MDSDGGDSEIGEVAACVDSPEGPVEQQETHAAAQKRARGQRGGQQAKLTPNQRKDYRRAWGGELG